MDNLERKQALINIRKAPPVVMHDIHLDPKGETQFVKNHDRVRAYRFICFHPGIGLKRLLKLLKVDQFDLPDIINPLAVEQGGFVKLLQGDDEICFFPKDPTEPIGPTLGVADKSGATNETEAKDT